MRRVLFSLMLFISAACSKTKPPATKKPLNSFSISFVSQLDAQLDGGRISFIREIWSPQKIDQITVVQDIDQLFYRWSHGTTPIAFITPSDYSIFEKNENAFWMAELTNKSLYEESEFKIDGAFVLHKPTFKGGNFGSRDLLALTRIICQYSDMTKSITFLGKVFSTRCFTDGKPEEVAQKTLDISTNTSESRRKTSKSHNF